MRVTTSVALGVALMMFVLAAAAQEPDSKQIFQSWIGKTLDGETTNGLKLIVVYAADGGATMSGSLTDRGKWRYSNDGFCVTWQRARGGSENCLRILPDGPNAYLTIFADSGEVSTRIVPR
jgi:hypothetical protein